MDIQILDFSKSHKLCVVTTKKGYSYSCLWAIERDARGNITSPTNEQVQEAWSNNKNDFDKYSLSMFL